MAVFSDETRERTPILGTNNTLNFCTKNIEVTELNGFNNYNFYLPDSITHHNIVLNVIGEKITDISGAKVFAVIPQVPTIDPHENIVLIKNPNGITDSDATNYNGVNEFDGTRQWQANPTSIYAIHVNKLDENNVVVSFTGNSVTPPANLIPRTRQNNMLSGGGDFISDFGGGIVFHTKLSDGNFYNGSIRGGRLKSDFESFDFGLNGYSVYERFTSNSPYIAAHFGINWYY